MMVQKTPKNGDESGSMRRRRRNFSRKKEDGEALKILNLPGAPKIGASLSRSRGPGEAEEIRRIDAIDFRIVATLGMETGKLTEKNCNIQRAD
jgi:hypothetical protein